MLCVLDFLINELLLFGLGDIDATSFTTFDVIDLEGETVDDAVFSGVTIE